MMSSVSAGRRRTTLNESRHCRPKWSRHCLSKGRAICRLTNFPIYSGRTTPARQGELLESLERVVRNFPEKSHKWESYVSLSCVNRLKHVA